MPGCSALSTAQGTRQDNVFNSHIKEKKTFWCLLVPRGWSAQPSLSDEVPALVQCEQRSLSALIKPEIYHQPFPLKVWSPRKVITNCP